MNSDGKHRDNLAALRDDTGSSAVEFALTLPLLILLSFGFFAVGSVMWSYHVASNSARDASRYAARLPATCTSGGVGSFTDTNATTYIQNLARTGSIDASANPLLPGWTSNTSITVTVNCVNNAATYSGRYDSFTKIPTVTVKVSAPVSNAFLKLFSMQPITSVAVSNTETYTE